LPFPSAIMCTFLLFYIFHLRCLKIQRINDPETEKTVLDVMKEAEQPVSCDYIAFNLQIGWGTARGVLLNMALKGKITALKTTKSFIFLLKEAT
jgi:hypothetical protein